MTSRLWNNSQNAQRCCNVLPSETHQISETVLNKCPYLFNLFVVSFSWPCYFISLVCYFVRDLCIFYRIWSQVKRKHASNSPLRPFYRKFSNIVTVFSIIYCWPDWTAILMQLFLQELLDVVYFCCIMTMTYGDLTFQFGSDDNFTIIFYRYRENGSFWMPLFYDDVLVILFFTISCWPYYTVMLNCKSKEGELVYIWGHLEHVIATRRKPFYWKFHT